MVLLYANASDLAAWSGAVVPSNVDQLLRSASLLVRRATVTAFYEVTPAGLPSDDDVAEAMRDATCAQAGHWAALGIDPAGGAAGAASAPVPQSSSIGGASVTYGSAAEAGSARMAAASNLCDEAAQLLVNAGLGGHPGAWG